MRPRLQVPDALALNVRSVVELGAVELGQRFGGDARMASGCGRKSERETGRWSDYGETESARFRGPIRVLARESNPQAPEVLRGLITRSMATVRYSNERVSPFAINPRSHLVTYQFREHTTHLNLVYSPARRDHSREAGTVSILAPQPVQSRRSSHYSNARSSRFARPIASLFVDWRSDRTSPT
jgi:hypothetical protein